MKGLIHTTALFLALPLFAHEGMGEIASGKTVDKTHYISVSKHANPMHAFLKAKLFEEKRYVESAYLAGIREKIQNNHTDSSLYRKYRSSYIDRGIYQRVKAAPEERDFDQAQAQAIAYLTDFYKSYAANSKLGELIPFKRDAPEEDLSGGFAPGKGDFEFMMPPNKKALARHEWIKTNSPAGALPYLDPEKEVSYFGQIDPDTALALIARKNGRNYSFHPVEFNNQKYVIAIHMRDGEFPYCNDNLLFFDCQDKTRQKVDPPLAGVLAQDAISIPKELFKAFKRKKTDLSLEEILKETLKDLSREKRAIHVDYPFVKKTDGKAPSAIKPLRGFTAQNSVILDDASYFPSKVRDIFYSPSSEKEYEAAFSFKSELRLMPGESVYLALPPQKRAYPVANVILGHRQNPRDQRGYADFDPRTGQKIYDKYPAYTSVQLHALGRPYKDSWRIWAGPVSSDKGSKFAEIKRSPEFDNLYEWPLMGHKSLRTLREEKGAFAADLVKLEVLGDDPVYIDSVTIKFIAPPAKNYVDISFTNTPTRLGDPVTFQGRSYGGGQEFGGKFPGAIELRANRFWDDEYEIDVRGKTIKAVSAAVGDTKPDGARNRDGGTGSLGAARVSILIEDIHGTEFVLVDEENIGPQGVVFGYADPQGIQAEKIIIKAHRDTAYLMGVQYGHD